MDWVTAGEKKGKGKRMADETIFLTICAIMVCVSVIVVGAAAVVYFQTRKILIRLEDMLSQAEKGSFNEIQFDETRLSRLETGFARFFMNSVLSKQKLEAEEEKVKTLIGDISHQTKTPISNIVLYTQLLREQELPEEADVYAVQIEKQSQKLNFLIHSLVKTSRLENGVVQVKVKRENVVELIREAVREQEEKAQKKGISLSVMLDEEPVFGEFDWKWTLEALGNILDNGIKYTETGGRVEIQVIPYPFFIRINIRDTGMGIKEEEYEKIFGRFYRSQDAAREDGVGIGLYLTRRILTEENGYLKVSSEYGAGSCFSVFLPRSRDFSN